MDFQNNLASKNILPVHLLLGIGCSGHKARAHKGSHTHFEFLGGRKQNRSMLDNDTVTTNLILKNMASFGFIAVRGSVFRLIILSHCTHNNISVDAYSLLVWANNI